MNVILADDQLMIRESLKIVLESEPDITVAGTAQDGVQALALLEKHNVDVAVLDIRMPKMDGVLCTREIKKRFPDVKVIILTTFDDDDFVYSALRYGASGYLLKGLDTRELVKAIRTVHQGGAMINPDVAHKVVDMFSRVSQTTGIEVEPEQEAALSDTERAIIREVGKGKSNREISKTLFLSEGTVRNYLSGILSKLDLRDRTQLAIWAVQSAMFRL
ncbi:response regulator transcription factor [uncultured Faecalibaculum sp.]|uniref:response regulator transcription factor n=1 Tax=uncultured Faecalibaculum sp. TaxID=1729681 RepID=UPI002615033E|nr:response regulator transcription factor [uncultured Faecalibaculum sp.]